MYSNHPYLRLNAVFHPRPSAIRIKSNSDLSVNLGEVSSSLRPQVEEGLQGPSFRRKPRALAKQRAVDLRIRPDLSIESSQGSGVAIHRTLIPYNGARRCLSFNQVNLLIPRLVIWASECCRIAHNWNSLLELVWNGSTEVFQGGYG